MRRAVSLSGVIFALFCMNLFVVPVAAQNDEQNDVGIPPGTPANGVDTSNQDDPPDVVIVAAENCRVSPDASITLEDGDGTQATFTDGERGIVISDQNGHPRIESTTGDFVGNHATFPDANDKSFDTDGDYTVVSSTGITGCTGGGPVQDQYEQTGAVDNPKGVVPKTAVGKKMPPTGGPPLLAVGVLTLLSAAVVVGRGILRP